MTALVDLRRKIETAQDLGSVVSTMKTLAAVSISQYEQAARALVDYAHTIDLGFHVVLAHQPPPQESLSRSSRTGALVFGTDQGMCGQFNESLSRYVLEETAADPARDWRFLSIGARMTGLLHEAGREPDDHYAVPTSASDMTHLVMELLPRIQAWQIEHKLGRLVVFYNQRRSASSYQAVAQTLLPLSEHRLAHWRHQRWESNSLPQMNASRRELFSFLIRQHLLVSLLRACAESLASENASRIAAMQQAENNIEEHLEDLERVFHQARQNEITAELQDVITGFEALSKPRTVTDDNPSQ